MNQKQVKQKLEVLKHPGTLIMLVDFMRQQYITPQFISDEEVANIIVPIVSRLRVMYENDIVPVEKSTQLDIIGEIEKLTAIGTVKKSKTKKK